MTAPLAVSIGKEARALVPMWAACAGALIVVGYLGDRRFWDGAPLVYLLGSVALASWSIGHEYSHRTLPILLSLPTTRRRLLVVKLAVVIPLLVMLGALALTVLPSRGLGRQEFPPLVAALGVACALVLAPLLTMLCRSPIAGVVFAPAITGTVHVLAQIAGLAVYGLSEPLIERDQFAMTLRLWGFATVATLAAVAGWLTFMNLEAVEGFPDVHWPYWWRRAAVSAAAAARRRNPFWLLVLKELRLQQMTFIVTGIFIVLAIVISMLSSVIREFNGSPEPLVALNGLILAWLLGSLASAEERHLGTLESQTLLPLAAWQQWIVKAGLTLALALLLAIGQPMVFALDGPQLNPVYIGIVVGIATTSLYVSSLCGSGVRALTVSGPAIVVAFLPLGRFFRPFDATAPSPLDALMLAGLLVLSLYFAFENHRSAERNFTRVGRQVLVMAAALALVARPF